MILKINVLMEVSRILRVSSVVPLKSWKKYIGCFSKSTLTKWTKKKNQSIDDCQKWRKKFNLLPTLIGFGCFISDELEILGVHSDLMIGQIDSQMEF